MIFFSMGEVSDEEEEEEDARARVAIDNNGNRRRVAEASVTRLKRFVLAMLMDNII